MQPSASIPVAPPPRIRPLIRATRPSIDDRSASDHHVELRHAPSSSVSCLSVNRTDPWIEDGI